MAKQLNLFSGQVITTSLHTEMQQSYLEYAMSVIVGRALPDVRDGLKPVHRRILYAMHELGLTPDRPYRKCARVVGDVLGKYHPHGDQSVYDALVRLVQEFSSRYPLLAGHGNFGSVDNDPPAAMRYTETRLAAVGHEGLLSQVGEATVNFISNFDNSQQEPTVLPAQLPFLLLNGSSGIAVGMATNIPPHNLGEVVDGLIALIDQPELSEQKLIELIPGPDFPTGGEIISTEGIAEAYHHGKGSIVVRGVAKMEEVPTAQKRRTKNAIVVTELPFQVNKAAWIEKIAGLVNAGKLEGISDIRDESDREGIRVVIELKREFSPEVVLHHLYQQTELMTKFGAIFLAIVNGQPRQLSLKQILQEFLSFREQTLTRQYRHELEAAERRCHLVEGLLLALENLDSLIEILRNAPDGSTAKITLENQLGFSDIQSDAILAMPMRRLTGLERQKLQEEFTQLTTNIEQLRRLLDERPELLKSLKKELRSLKRKYGDERRTRIIYPQGQTTITSEDKTAKKSKEKILELTSPPDVLQPLPPVDEETVIEITHRGYIRRVSPKTADSKRNQTENKTAINIEETDDFITQTHNTKTSQNLVMVLKTGKAYPLSVADIPVGNNRSKGKPIITLLSPSAYKDTSINPQDLMIAQFLLSAFPDKTDLITLTQQGKIKRLPLIELAELTNRGSTIVKLKDDDELSFATLSNADEKVVLATSGGRLLRFDLNDEQLPPMGKVAQGSQATRLRQKEHLIGCVTLSIKGSLLLVTEQGYIKRIAMELVRGSNRGGIGISMIQFKSPNDILVGIAPAKPRQQIHLLTSDNRIIHVPTDQINLSTKDSTGDRIFKLKPDERIISIKS
ncbi:MULTISPECIES: DNA topoisomerase (ATP-hydrolyzing) subunit A [Planktothrix]|uniref:DNA topoisomerase (ATP-hydrolyzing) n=2 Tax=Planktothrix TaxID=54304 RepID=A0A073CIR3_PLAA1|nr:MULTISPECIES: DNA topoisomerase (ATP-hydrolyzing) subunit A [Planktothrix]KEI67613.1 GyrA [Planktothrix agardhii NIVA-CYA 126/8]CAC5343760.1 DNA topoisomerase 4 subunit A [Planktothrix rubescens NIVA-CYA 18]CAD5949032.1 DNA topoisomerase 4 subunit A [Planktothrix agardhii]CAD5980947.1 DNA topoisomerase 4 subunit A [Planktothrix rubescens NIVA-CYA 18]